MDLIHYLSMVELEELRVCIDFILPQSLDVMRKKYVRPLMEQECQLEDIIEYIHVEAMMEILGPRMGQWQKMASISLISGDVGKMVSGLLVMKEEWCIRRLMEGACTKRTSWHRSNPLVRMV